MVWYGLVWYGRISRQAIIVVGPLGEWGSGSYCGDFLVGDQEKGGRRCGGIYCVTPRFNSRRTMKTKCVKKKTYVSILFEP